MKKYNIGITFNLEHKNKDIWSNSVHQNLFFYINFLMHWIVLKMLYL